MTVTTTAVCDSLQDLDHMIDHVTSRKIGYKNIPLEGLLIESKHVPKNVTDKIYDAETILKVEEVNEDPTARKFGRNDPCWCGSGEKFKRCHGRPRTN